ncbi:MAG: acyltransferase [Pseudolabrys sp.]
MSLVLNAKYSNVWLFWTNRALRLYPAFLFFVALTWGWFFLAWMWLGKPPQNSWMAAYADMHWWQSALIVLSNWTMLGQDIASVLAYEAGKGFSIIEKEGLPLWVGWLLTIRPAWSLSVEIIFYLLAPALVRLNGVWLLLIAAVSLAVHVSTGPMISYYLFPSNLWLFIIGISLHRTMPYFERLPLWSLGALAAPLSVAMIYWIPSLEPAVYFLAAAAVPPLFLVTRNWRLDRAIGDLSYPIYLGHLPITLIFQNTLHVNSGPLVLAATTAMAFLVVRLIDHPIDRWRQRRVRQFNRPVWEKREGDGMRGGVARRHLEL